MLFKKGHNAKQESSSKKLLSKLREILKCRGAVGIIGLGRNFRIMDDDRSGYLDINEFTKAMNDFGLGFSR